MSAAPAAFPVALADENCEGGGGVEPGDWALFTVFGEITAFFPYKVVHSTG